MKKKIFFCLIIALIGVLCILPASASCDVCIEGAAVEPSGHCPYHCTGESYETCGSCGDQFLFEYCTATHLYTCSANGDGTHTGTCKCGDSYSTSCSYIVVSTQPSTCTAAGYNTIKCTSCGHVTTESIPLADHSYTDEPTTIVSPTCTTGGYSRWYCESCDHFYDDNVSVPLGHNFSELVTSVPSTCQTHGYIINKCSRCDVREQITLPLSDHPWPIEPTEIVSATCTTAGETREKCTACDEWRVTRYEPALGHDWTSGYTEATCISDGIDLKVCARCGLDLSVTYPKLGHKWSEKPIANTSTCYFAGKATYVCTVCGETEDRNAAKLPHNYIDDICTMCGKTKDASEIITPGGTPGISPGGSGSSSGGSSSGNSSGSSGVDSFDDLDTRPLLYALTAFGITIVVAFISADRSRKRRKKRRK